MLCLSVTAEESANNFKNKLSNLFPGVNEKKLLGHRMGTRMMGLAPRPPFSQANCGLEPTSGRSRFSLMISKVLLCRPSLAWGPLAGLSRLLFFRLGVFVFLFLSVSILDTPLKYENLLHLLYRILILAGLEFRIPRKSSL